MKFTYLHTIEIDNKILFFREGKSGNALYETVEANVDNVKTKEKDKGKNIFSSLFGSSKSQQTYQVNN